MRRALPLGLILLTPTLALAAAPRTFADLANIIVSFLNSAAGLLILAGIVIYFGGIVRTLMKTRSGEDTAKLRTLLIWGIVAIFLMVSIWGILEVLQSTIFSSSPYDPSTGTPASSPSFEGPQFR